MEKRNESERPRDAQIVIKSAEGRTVTVSDQAYRVGRERLLREGMANVQNRRHPRFG